MAEKNQVKYRNELKYYINMSDIFTLKNRLRFVMNRDSYALKNGSYKIRSLYFDTIDDAALIEKLDGVSDREKYRIRFYNDDTNFIRLEKKIKHNNMTRKESVPLSKLQVEAIICGNIGWMIECNNNLLNDLYYKMTAKGLKPKTIVDYTREAYIYPFGNVRITMDTNIRTGLKSIDLFNPDIITVPVFREGISVLEIKYDEFLPDIIKTLVQIGDRERQQASKYASCRLYL